jgi:formamidopyrimidine-DNA glycosylase
MPELPEVETVRRGLAVRLEGRVIARVVKRRADLRVPMPRDLARRLEGRRVQSIDRRAKYLLFRFDSDDVLIAHLGMSGRMVLRDDVAAPYETHDHVVIDTDEGWSIRFNDARRFGVMLLADAAKLTEHPLLRDIGPEPLGNEFSGELLWRALDGRRTPVKAALLDQKTVAGVGNIYACEALFRAGIKPTRLACDVGPKRADALAQAIRSVLGEAIEAGGSSLRDHVQPSGELGYFQHRWAVYDREGQNCHDGACGGVIRRIVQSNRSTFFCPRHQK